ncbi:uncharacterized protein [Amphiura filiformis]|uniref:uncharacterized protein n=1 Tax=Amphiura filiformis TaxID=82378 RepID=UPI003B214383
MASYESKDDALEKLLTCRHCMQLFDDKSRYPRILGCMHTICDQCIRTLIKNKHVLCPYCKNIWKIPYTGFPTNTVVTNYLYNYRKMHGYLPTIGSKVDCGNCLNVAVGYCNDWAMNVCRGCIVSHKLTNISKVDGRSRPECDNCPNVAVGYCYDWAMNVCQMCIDKHKLWHIMKIRSTNRINHIVKHTSKTLCKRHPNQFLSMFCVTCNVTGCTKCLKSTHHRHDCIDLDTAAEQSKDRLRALTQHFRIKDNPIQGPISSIDDHMSHIDKVKLQKEHDIDEAFDTLVERLEDKREDAKMGFRQVCAAKKQVLKGRRREMEGVGSELESVAEFAEQLCKFASPEQVLELQQQVTDRVQALHKKNNNFIQFHESVGDTNLSLDNMHTKAVAEAHKVISRIGQVSPSPLPSRAIQARPLPVPSPKDVQSTSASSDDIKSVIDERHQGSMGFIPVNVTRAPMPWFQSSARRVPRNTSIALQAMAKQSLQDSTEGQQNLGPRFDLSIFNR